MLRRLLHVSDIHCSIKKLEEVFSIRAKDVDAITLSGDLECNGKVVEILSSLGKPIFAVTGNMDDHYIARILDEAGFNIENRVISYKSFVFAGISGRDPVTSIKQVSEKLREYISPSNRIIVIAHHPPKGVADKSMLGVHAGLYEARKLIEEFKPYLYLCGHIHEARGYDFVGGTLVVNPGPLKKGYYAIIDLEARRVELKKL